MYMQRLKTHINLKEACQDWNRSTVTTWTKMKTYFSTEIKMNKTDPAIMCQKEQANTVLNQTKEHEATQQQALEVVVLQLQTQQLQALEEILEQQLVNIATSSGSSIPGRIPATIYTNSSGSGSTASTVTKEEMMQIFAKFNQNFQQGKCTEINSTETKVTGKEKKKANFELTTSQMISEEDNNQSKGSRIRQAIARNVGMISNQLTQLWHAQIRRVS